MATKKLNKIVKQLTRKFFIFILVTINFLITTFVILNSIELLFIKDLPYINSISNFGAEAHIQSIRSQQPTKEQSTEIYSLAQASNPVSIRMGTIDAELNLSPILESEGELLLQQNKAHYFNLREVNEDTGFFDNYLVVYSQESWRTLNNTEELSNGDLLFVETDNNRQLLYRIQNKATYRISDTEVIIPEESDISIVIHNRQEKVAYIIHAGLVTSSQI